MADIGTAYVKVAPNMQGIQGKIAGGLRGSGSKFAEQFGGEISGRSAVIVGAIAGVASAAASRAMNMISSSIGGAIKRVDTLNNAARTFENMGFAAETSSEATEALTKSILGLPTPLDSAMRGMTSLAATYGDIDKGQKVFSSLNNAILGFGGSAEMVDNAIMQLSQLPLDGPLDAQTWNSLRNSGLTPLLVAMAKESGMSVNEMKKAFGEGELTVQDFTDRLVKMNTDGGGGLKSLETIAKDATSGIGTGMANMQTAITRGVAEIIKSVGSENISGAITSIGAGFEKVLKVIAANVPKAVAIISGFVNFIVKYKDIFVPIAVGIGAALVALKAWTTYLAISKAVMTVYTATTAYFSLVNSLMAQGLSVSRAAMMGLNIAMSANPIGIVIALIVALVAGLVYFFTQTETGRKIFTAAFNGIKSVVQGVFNWIKSNWGLLLAILTGPIGIAVGLIVRHWSTIRGAFQSAYNFVTGLWGRIGGFFGNIFNSIKNAFSAIPGVGMDIVKGLWHGISSMGNWLKDKLISFVKDKIPGPVKKALGISSPSKVFASFGKDSVRGYAEGVSKNANLAASAVNDLAQTAINSMSAPVAAKSVAFGGVNGVGLGGQSGAGNTTNQSVNIQKIVLADESAVKEFFRQLNRDTIYLDMGMTPHQGAAA